MCEGQLHYMGESTSLFVQEIIKLKVRYRDFHILSLSEKIKSCIKVSFMTPD